MAWYILVVQDLPRACEHLIAAALARSCSPTPGGRERGGAGGRGNASSRKQLGRRASGRLQQQHAPLVAALTVSVGGRAGAGSVEERGVTARYTPGPRALLSDELSTTEAFAARTCCPVCHASFSRGPVVYVRESDAWVRHHCSLGRVLCAQLRHQIRSCGGAVKCSILSAIEAFAARVSCPICRSLFSCDPTVRLRDRGAWVQHRCSAGHMCCAQMPPDSQCDGAGNCQISATEAFAASANCSLL